jgi:hypothetical protein
LRDDTFGFVTTKNKERFGSKYEANTNSAWTWLSRDKGSMVGDLSLRDFIALYARVFFGFVSLTDLHRTKRMTY